MSELPAGWTRTLLGSISKVRYGKGLPKKSRVASGSIPVYGSAGIVGFHDTALVQGPTIIVGRKGNAGEAFLSEGPSWPIDTTYFLHPPPEIIPRLLQYQLNEMELGQSSTTIPSLRRPDLEAAVITIAPIAEQRRIIAAIEIQFAHLDAAEESLQRAERNVIKLRASILREAFAGRLVHQDPSDEPAEALLERVQTPIATR